MKIQGSQDRRKIELEYNLVVLTSQKIPLLPNSVGKKSVNDAGPQQGHNKLHPKALNCQ